MAWVYCSDNSSCCRIDMNLSCNLTQLCTLSLRGLGSRPGDSAAGPQPEMFRLNVEVLKSASDFVSSQHGGVSSSSTGLCRPLISA